MTNVLEALLALQQQDNVVDEITSRVEAILPRLRALDAARDQAQRTLDEGRALVEGDERRQREIEGRLSEHRQRHERNQAHLDSVKRLREATAAMLQVEAGRKLLLEEENELRALVGRVADGHGFIKRQEEALAGLDREQAAAREAVTAERGALEAELTAARQARTVLAARVEGGVLRKYERIRTRRRAQAVFALNGGACGNCDTAVPIQRRRMMSSTGAIEVCEGCGVLLYAME